MSPWFHAWTAHLCMLHQSHPHLACQKIHGISIIFAPEVYICCCLYHPFPWKSKTKPMNIYELGLTTNLVPSFFYPNIFVWFMAAWLAALPLIYRNMFTHMFATIYSVLTSWSSETWHNSIGRLWPTYLNAPPYLEDHPTDHNWLVTGASSPTYKNRITLLLETYDHQDY